MDKNNCFKLKQHYSGSTFMNFFRDNYKRLLTIDELEFLNVYKHCVDSDCKYYTESEIKHYKRRIKQRIEEAYEEHKKNKRK